MAKEFYHNKESFVLFEKVCAFYWTGEAERSTLSIAIGASLGLTLNATDGADFVREYLAWVGESHFTLGEVVKELESINRTIQDFPV